MSEEHVTITVDGKELQAPKGAMLIEITDQNDIHVPRFCYHKKLSVAANCRMCLVDVEKAQHWNSRRHFFAAAAESMRRIVLNRARDKKRLKRGGDRRRVDHRSSPRPDAGVGR